MKRNLHLSLLCLLSLALSGCVDREYADNTLKKGCLAGINALLPEGSELKEVIDIKFEPSPVGPDFRHVEIKALEMDGWLEEETSYKCVFQESFSFMNKTHTASIYQIRIGDRLVGKSGNEIVGTVEDFTKLTDAMREAMYE